MKTFSAKPQEVERKWYVIDAADKVLGRVAVEAANILRGKNKTIFTPHVDCGDFVIIVNADKVVLTGNKENAKIYTRFSGGNAPENPRPSSRASSGTGCKGHGPPYTFGPSADDQAEGLRRSQPPA